MNPTQRHLACAVAAAALLGACAGTGTETSAAAPQAQNAAPAAAAPASPTGQYSEQQLRAFVTVSQQVAMLSQGTTEAERAEYTRRAGEILQQNGLDAVTYNAIAERARTDQPLAQHIAELRVQNLSDDTLRRFVLAANEIQPINASLATATPEQRTQAAERIRTVLAQHHLDSATYNAIAERAQSDPALAARIAALRGPARG